MYPVSDAYRAAIAAPVREDRITGGIRLTTDEIIPITDETIVQKSLSITRKVFSSKFDIGTVNSAEMRLKIRNGEAYEKHNYFGGAVISLKYGIVTATAEDGTKTWEDIPLPPFYVDGAETSRKGNVISIIAHDTISKLAVDKGSPPTDSLYNALLYLTNRCATGLNVPKDFNDLPNSDIKPDFSAESIQTCWDAIMWIAQALGCCVFADYRGLVTLRRYYYTSETDCARRISGKERTGIEYTDTRTFLSFLQSYEGNDVKVYANSTSWTGTDATHTRDGALCLPKNPILAKLTAEQQRAVNKNYLKKCSYPTRYIKATGVNDPALEPLDILSFYGGTIDIGEIAAPVTQITWKFRNGGTLICQNIDEYSPAADVKDWQENVVSAQSLDDEVATQADDEETTPDLTRLQPKSQLEKRVDELEARGGGNMEKLHTKGTNYYAKTDEKGVQFGVGGDDGTEAPFAYLKGTASTGIEMRTYGMPSYLKVGGGGIDIVSNSSDGTSEIFMPTGKGIGLMITSTSKTNGDAIFSIGGGKIDVSIYPGSISISSGVEDKKLLLTVTDGELYFNGKKVLTE